MLLRCKNPEPPMSQLGQTEKNSLRANVFRSCPNNRHRWAVPALPGMTPISEIMSPPFGDLAGGPVRHSRNGSYGISSGEPFTAA